MKTTMDPLAALEAEYAAGPARCGGKWAKDGHGLAAGEALPCTFPPVGVVTVQCRYGHEEREPLCRRHLSGASRGALRCTPCTPAEEPTIVQIVDWF